MSRWEIKVYAFNHGHLYTMHSDAKLESIKNNMMRRFRESKNHAHKTAMIVIRDLREDYIVHVRKIGSSGKPKHFWQEYDHGYRTREQWDNWQKNYFTNRSSYKWSDF